MGLLDRFKSQEWHEKKQREQHKAAQINRDYEAGRYCKICHKTGEFDNQCDKCGISPICDDDRGINKTHGTVCRNCYSKYQCRISGCNSLWDDGCVVCGTHVCNHHWSAFFVYDKNIVFQCVVDKGPVCRSCVESGKTGTFKKKYGCRRCGYELQPQPRT